MYLITRDELVKMIKKETNVGFRTILENHLAIMDGGLATCAPCVEAAEKVEETKPAPKKAEPAKKEDKE